MLHALHDLRRRPEVHPAVGGPLRAGHDALFIARARAGQAGLRQDVGLGDLRRSSSAAGISASTGWRPGYPSPSRATTEIIMANASEVSQFGVHSEVGQLRKVMVCAPGQGARAADAVQLRRPAVRRRDVGGERQARPLRLHHQDARPRHRRRRDAQPAGRDGRGPRGEGLDPRPPGRAQPGGPRPRRRGPQLPRRAAATASWPRR